jgi:hypothetical protein
LQERYDETARLTEDVAARDSEIRELRGVVQNTKLKLSDVQATTERDEKRLQSQIAELETENRRLQDDLRKRKAELASLNAKSKASATGSDAESRKRAWWWLAGGIAAVTALIGGVWWIGGQRVSEVPQAPEEEKT